LSALCVAVVEYGRFNFDQVEDGSGILLIRYKRVSILLNVSHLNQVISTMSDAVRQSTDDHTLRYLQLRSEMVTTARHMKQILDAFALVRAEKVALDVKLAEHRALVGSEVVTDLEAALLRSVYEDLHAKYRELLVQGAALGAALGQVGDSTAP
jgi:hypothetical protein